MIYLTRINHNPLILNPDLIEHIQATPDTVIMLTSGRNYLVLESPDEIIRRIISYRREILTRHPSEMISGADRSEAFDGIAR